MKNQMETAISGLGFRGLGVEGFRVQGSVFRV